MRRTLVPCLFLVLTPVAIQAANTRSDFDPSRPAPTSNCGRFEYRLLATSKTLTMQKELQEAGDAGFEFVGVTVDQTPFGGNEVFCIPRRRAQR